MKPELIVLIRGECMVIKLVTHLSTFLLMQRTSMLSFPLKDSVPSLLMAHMPIYSTKERPGNSSSLWKQGCRSQSLCLNKLGSIKSLLTI